MLIALRTFDKTASGITVGIILLIIALCFAAAACMDLLLISKVNLQNGEVYIVIPVVDCHTRKVCREGEAWRYSFRHPKHRVWEINLCLSVNGQILLSYDKQFYHPLRILSSTYPLNTVLDLGHFFFLTDTVVVLNCIHIVMKLCLLTCICAFSSWQIHRIYRSTGASFAKAQQEFTTEFLRNEHVQNAASNAAAATIRAQMSSSNRYWTLLQILKCTVTIHSCKHSMNWTLDHVIH